MGPEQELHFRKDHSKAENWWQQLTEVKLEQNYFQKYRRKTLIEQEVIAVLAETANYQI